MHIICIMRTVILTEHSAPIPASGCPRLHTTSGGRLLGEPAVHIHR